jgi:hypothetical protein
MTKPMLPLIFLAAGIFGISRSDMEPVNQLTAVSIVMAITFYFVARLRERGGVLIAAPFNDQKTVAERVVSTVEQAGYRCLPSTGAGRWDFKLASGLFANEPVWVEYAGAESVRTVAPRWLLNRIASRHAGSMFEAYTGKQHWSTRGKGLLLPATVIVAGLVPRSMVTHS